MGNVLAVYRFELRRALTAPRMLWWGLLAFFPVLIVTLITLIPEDIPREPWWVFTYALIPMLVSMLGTFLWTTSAVAAELEQQSWVYLAVKPGGRSAVLLGKYLAAVSWVLPAAIVSLTICTAIINTSGRSEEALTAPGEMGFYPAFLVLACLSVPAYAAVYLALGTIFVKRSMVMAVAYTLVFELLIGKIPALINKLTVQHHLFATFFKWSGIPADQMAGFLSAQLIGDAKPSTHILIVIGYTVTALMLALLVVRSREYVTATAADA